MIYCLNCGKGIPDQSKFCTFCGAAIKSVDKKIDTTITDQDNDRTRATNDRISDRTTEHDRDQQNKNTHSYIDQDGIEHVRTTPVSHDHITPTPSNQDLTTPAHRNTDVRNEDVSRSTRQPFVTDATPSHIKDTTTDQNNIIAHPKNEFYKNLGFWGAVLVLIGFFVPYVTTNASFFSVVTDVAPSEPLKFIYLVFPVSALLLIIQAFTPVFPKSVLTIFKILPVLMLIVIFIALSKDDFLINASGGDLNSIFSYLSIGFYLTVIGSILMIFFNQHRNRS